MSFISDVLTNLPGIGQVAGIMSNIWNNTQQTKINEQNLEFAREQATTAFERQNQLLDKQNAYNDPKAQMQRYVDAGLNPNLIYGTPNLSAAVPSVATGSPGNAIAPQVNPSQIADIKQTEKSSDLTVAQAREILGDTPMSKAKIKETLANTKYLQTLTDSISFTAGVERYKSNLLNDEGDDLLVKCFPPFQDENGEWVAAPRWLSMEMKDVIYDMALNQLKASDSDYQLAVETLANRIAGVAADTKHKQLENQDLQAFVEVCGRIYEGSASEADLLKVVSDLDKDLYQTLDLSGNGMKAVFEVLRLFVTAFSRITTSPIPSPGRKKR